MLFLDPAQELPLPGVYTGDETWFSGGLVEAAFVLSGTAFSAEPPTSPPSGPYCVVSGLMRK